jgi:hypothetical protein
MKCYFTGEWGKFILLTDFLLLPMYWHKRILEPIKYILKKEGIITIKHLGGEVSVVISKSFGKARDKFKGASIDLIWE